eukprot:SAG31_NODE_9483_length_1270_cov_0.872758_1_plen_47_part_10
MAVSARRRLIFLAAVAHVAMAAAAAAAPAEPSRTEPSISGWLAATLL